MSSFALISCCFSLAASLIFASNVLRRLCSSCGDQLEEPVGLENSELLGIILCKLLNVFVLVISGHPAIVQTAEEIWAFLFVRFRCGVVLASDI
jgi:hypothetical protein